MTERDPIAGAQAGAEPSAGAPPGGEPIAPGGGTTPGGSAGPSALSRLWREWIRPLLVVLAVMLSFRSALADWNDVPSGSMKPTIVEGDRIFVNKAAYDLRVPFTRVRLLEWAEPERGDIVVLFSPADGERLVKRVVGLPGDEVEMRHGRLFLDGVAVPYTPMEPDGVEDLAPGEREGHWFALERLGEADHPVMLAPWPSARGFYGPVVVPEDHFFVMGDNRSHSRDSRSFGFVERSSIVGKATAVVLSFDKERYYRPRWDRFFHPLR